MSAVHPSTPKRRARLGPRALVTLVYAAVSGGPILLASRPTLALTPGDARSAPIPAFSRMYGTACSTCHTAAPKLNVLGEAFRLNGYRMPSSQLLLRRDDPVALGAPEWAEAWPRAIRPGELPGIAPLALRLISDVRVTRDERTPYASTFLFPQEVKILGGAPLGEGVAVFVEAGWTPDDGFGVRQAKVELQDVVPGLPSRLLNVWVGLQDPYLLTLANHHTDQAARQPFTWQTFRASDVEVVLDGAPSDRTSNAVALGEPQPALELNGLVGGRLYYGLGVAQEGDVVTDVNGRKDLYYKVRYKLGGLSLDGRYGSDDVPEQGVPGQLLDRSLILEHFGYFGDEATPASPQGRHRGFGVAARALLGRLDVGAGYAVRTFEHPWRELETGDLRATSVFGKAEYTFLPWVVGSLKAERFELVARELPSHASLAPTPGDATRVLPGLVLLLRQNVRLVTEGELYLRSPETDRAGLARPHNLWLRLDVAF